MMAKPEDFETFEKLVKVYLNTKIKLGSPTEDDLIEACYLVRNVINLSETDLQKTIKKLQTEISVKMDTGDVLTLKHEPWLMAKKAMSNIEFDYWDRYVNYLTMVKGWSSDVVASMDKISDRIIDYAGDPKVSGRLKRRGLLIGDVQSGKTSNYLAIMNKAADVGYKVIILLTGTIESLRRQTQERVEDGFIGRSSKTFLSRQKTTVAKGVGKKDINPKMKFAAGFTTEESDFKSSTIQGLNLNFHSYAEPVVFVMKKNAKILQNLIDWLEMFNLETNGLVNSPVLLIDDEADNASINTGADNDPTTINRLIRKILSLFFKSSYLAVTATPFANIFILPEKTEEMKNDDLFPADYIYSLNPPTSYIGNNEIFADTGKYTDVIRLIDDADQFFPYKHKQDIVIDLLPESLEAALYHFILANVVLDIRSNVTHHRSMMVNVSRFVKVQEQISKLINGWRFTTEIDIKNNCMLSEIAACRNATLSKLRANWNQQFESLVDVPWFEVQQNYLLKAIRPIQVFTINQRSTDKLDYSLFAENGLRVIAVGGLSLSRGLTLEGLTVSYFYRNSQAYDTLMQMGRWFGFRSGYEDLFRLWMPEDAVAWYYHITEACNELREDIVRMNQRGALPSEFALRVRAHPTSLTITARSKMKHTEKVECWITLDGRFFETPRFISEIQCIRSNIAIASSLIQSIFSLYGIPKHKQRNLYWQNVKSEIVCEFLRRYNNHPENSESDGQALVKYINDNFFNHDWDIVISGGESSTTLNVASLEVPTIERNLSTGSIGVLSAYGTKMRIGTMGLTKMGLSEQDSEKAENDFRIFKREEYQTRYGADAEVKLKRMSIPDRAYLIEGRNPILILHVIEPKFLENEDDRPQGFVDGIDFFIGYGIGFPKSPTSEPIYARYYVNTVKQREYFEDELEEDQIDGSNQ